MRLGSLSHLPQRKLGEVADEAVRPSLREGPSATNPLGFGSAAPSRILLRSGSTSPKQSLGEVTNPLRRDRAGDVLANVFFEHRQAVFELLFASWDL